MSQYATTADLALYALSSAALGAFSTDEQNAALAAASDYADGELARRYALPLASWPTDLREAVSGVAAYKLLARRGFDSADEGSSFRRQYDAALAYLKRVGDGTLDPPGVVDATPDVDEAVVVVFSNPRRGW